MSRPNVRLGAAAAAVAMLSAGLVATAFGPAEAASDTVSDAQVIKADHDRSAALTEIARQATTAPQSGTVWEERGPMVPDDGYYPGGAQDAIGGPAIAAIPPDVHFPGLTGTAKPTRPQRGHRPNHYVEMVNFSVGVFKRDGTPLLTVPIGLFFAGLHGTHPCESNSGDPVVLHDQLADRWLLTQFTSGGPTFYLCMAVSQTPNPTGECFLMSSQAVDHGSPRGSVCGTQTRHLSCSITAATYPPGMSQWSR